MAGMAAAITVAAGAATGIMMVGEGAASAATGIMAAGAITMVGEGASSTANVDFARAMSSMAIEGFTVVANSMEIVEASMAAVVSMAGTAADTDNSCGPSA